MKHHCLKNKNNNLNMKHITDADYMHTKRFCKDFEVKIFKRLWGKYELYFKSNTLLLADIFENFRKMCLEIYQLDSANSF